MMKALEQVIKSKKKGEKILMGSTKISLTTNGDVKKTLQIFNTSANDTKMVALANAYTSLLANNDTLKSVNKIVTTPLSIA